MPIPSGQELPPFPPEGGLIHCSLTQSILMNVNYLPFRGEAAKRQRGDFFKEKIPKNRWRSKFFKEVKELLLSVVILFEISHVYLIDRCSCVSLITTIHKVSTIIIGITGNQQFLTGREGFK